MRVWESQIRNGVAAKAGKSIYEIPVLVQRVLSERLPTRIRGSLGQTEANGACFDDSEATIAIHCRLPVGWGDGLVVRSSQTQPVARVAPTCVRCADGLARSGLTVRAHQLHAAK